MRCGASGSWFLDIDASLRAEFGQDNRQITSPPAAPADLRLRHGELSGTIVARYKPSRSPGMNELQTSTGAPNDPASWHTAGMYPSGKAQLTDLTPGELVWVRARTTGLKGVMGAWSDPAQIRVV